MKGRVAFWFTYDEQKNVGMVLFRLFGQRCQSCSPKLFEHAMWYPEEVVKVYNQHDISRIQNIQKNRL